MSAAINRPVTGHLLRPQLHLNQVHFTRVAGHRRGRTGSVKGSALLQGVANFGELGGHDVVRASPKFVGEILGQGLVFAKVSVGLGQGLLAKSMVVLLGWWVCVVDFKHTESVELTANGLLS